MERRQYPLYIRLALVSAATGVAGWLIRFFGSSFVDPSTNAKLYDLMPAVGSSIMSACSLMFLIVAAATVIDCARTKTFTWTHAIILALAGCVTVAAGIDGAYPR
ncbi:hypothetical protein [Stieleria mannarensis]|uniref:hypothetical protein n=1 Tax=Stieleria mannarensis TaxID=2755585 RepID=UPI001602185C|nr:hypothetical protein [Rhodopirellula sp. JC639]